MGFLCFVIFTISSLPDPSETVEALFKKQDLGLKMCAIFSAHGKAQGHQYHRGTVRRLEKKTEIWTQGSK